MFSIVYNNGHELGTRLSIVLINHDGWWAESIIRLSAPGSGSGPESGSGSHTLSLPL